MMTPTAGRLSAELADVDHYPDPAIESLCAERDSTWAPPLTSRGGLCVVRTVMYLSTLGDGTKLAQPLKIEVSSTEDGACQFYSAVLDVSGVGESLGAAANDFLGTVSALWAEFSATPIEDLAPDAQSLLYRLRSTFG